MTEFDEGVDRTAAAPAFDRPSTFSSLPPPRPEPDTERLWAHEPPTRPMAPAASLPSEPHGSIPSVAQLAGHPLHPAVIPLPIGAFAGAFAADLAYAATGDRFWARAGRTLVGAGVVTGLLAGGLGAIDFLGRSRIRAHGSAWLHAAGNLAAILLGIASLRARGRDGAGAVVPVGLATTGLIAAILGVTGWLGGELAFRHRIGVPDEEI